MLKNRNKRKNTVKNRIFYSNVLMILVTIVLCAVIGIICAEIYWHREEALLEGLLGNPSAGSDAEELIKGLTVRNSLFIQMAVIFALLSVTVLVLVNRIYTSLLTKRILQPLELLEQGSERIRVNDYSTPVVYHGDREFEQVCEAFNDMQQHLKEEKEKNTRYEKARQEMIVGISHDLRSPLTAIRGSVKGVLDGVVSEPEQQRKFLQAAYRRSGEMDMLLNELFYFSKLETGGIPVQMQEINLSEYLQNYFDAKKDLPDYADVEFVCDIPTKELKSVQADPEALQRILDNILSNSRKYAGVSPLRFFVSLHQEKDAQQIILQDNGVGVPKDRLNRIFDEFFRVDDSRGRKEGSGLGLYIVKFLCEAMGGHVHADMASHHEGFTGLAVSLTLKEGEIRDGGEGQDSDS